MALDQATRDFLAKSNSKTAPPPGEMPLADFRAAVEPFRALGFEREEVALVEDLNLPGSDGATVAVRLYRPATEEPVPVMVWAHGGSWVRVTVDLLDNHFRAMANASGCALAAVDYRLSPEARFPSAIEEVLTAARWIKEHGDEYGLDTARIGVGGESSGGNVAAAAALLDRDRGDVGFVLQALVLPVLDVGFDTDSWRDLGEGYLLTRAQLEWALAQYAPGVDVSEPLLSPPRAASHEGLPPALIRTGEYDPLKDEGEAYAATLRAAGVEVDFEQRPGLIHHAVMAPGLMDTGRALVLDTAAVSGALLRAS